MATGELNATEELEDMVQGLFGCLEMCSRVERGDVSGSHTKGIENVQMGEEPGVTRSLLKQAQASLAQAQANGETPRAMHFLTQRVPSKGAIEIPPDRFESWYAAECDAQVGIAIAGEIAKQAE